MSKSPANTYPPELSVADTLPEYVKDSQNPSTQRTEKILEYMNSKRFHEMFPAVMSEMRSLLSRRNNTVATKLTIKVRTAMNHKAPPPSTVGVVPRDIKISTPFTYNYYQ